MQNFKEYLIERKVGDISFNEIFLTMKQAVHTKLPGHRLEMKPNPKGATFAVVRDTKDGAGKITDTFTLVKKKFGKGYRMGILSLGGENKAKLKLIVDNALKASKLSAKISS